MLVIKDAVYSSLVPAMKLKIDSLKTIYETNGLDLLVYCGFRSALEQNQLFCKSRSMPDRAEKEKQLRLLGLTTAADYLKKVSLVTSFAGGSNITNAVAGESSHNYGAAIDAVPTKVVDGKVVTMWGDNKGYAAYGASAVLVGLEWAGNWISFKESPHCQLSTHSVAYMRQQIKSGIFVYPK